MTRTGAVMGTPFYMSPEQAKGSGGVDQKSDLYAVGVILYEAVTGEVPFLASTFNELLFKIVLSDPKPLPEVVPGIDPAFVGLVSRAMARDPGQRFSSAKEMIEGLDALGLGMRTQGADPALAMAPVPAPVRLATTPQPGMPTQGTFSTSQAGAGKKGVPIALLAGGLTLLVMVGVAFGAYKALSGGGEETTTAASAEAPATLAAAPAPPAPAAEPPKTEVAPATSAPAVAVAPAPSASAAKAAGVAPRVTPRPRPASGKPATGSKGSRDFGY
jgi:serine/threonine-protein kinase